MNLSRTLKAAGAALVMASLMAGAADARGFRSALRAHNANAAVVDQRGRDNGAAVVQQGQGNVANLRQVGNGNSGAITQNGNNNTACLWQYGNGLGGAITQNGNGQNMGVVQTNRGVYSLPTEYCALGMTREQAMNTNAYRQSLPR